MHRTSFDEIDLANQQQENIVGLNVKNIQYCITVIDGIPFYYIHGFKNTRTIKYVTSYKKTWFPFAFINSNNSIFRPASPNYYGENKSVSTLECYPKDIIKYFIDKKLDDHLLRLFANFDAMCLSALIGKGFWKRKKGKALKAYLNKKHKNDMLQLKETHKALLNELRTASLDNIHYYDNHNPLNQWLDDKGSVANATKTIPLDFRKYHIKPTTPPIKKQVQSFFYGAVKGLLLGLGVAVLGIGIGLGIGFLAASIVGIPILITGAVVIIVGSTLAGTAGLSSIVGGFLELKNTIQESFEQVSKSFPPGAECKKSDAGVDQGFATTEINKSLNNLTPTSQETHPTQDNLEYVAHLSNTTSAKLVESESTSTEEALDDNTSNTNTGFKRRF